jgi:uncharacterized damage-inducible protein DinB
MLEMIRSLYAHQAWADATILKAIAQHEAAAQDEELRKTLHHIVVVQRYFLSLFRREPFDFAVEMRAPDSLEAIQKLFRASHANGLAYVSQMPESDLPLTLEVPHLPGVRLNKGEAHLQVVMHSQHHRGQCAARLRSLGGVPPTVDFIVWLKERPAAWS